VSLCVFSAASSASKMIQLLYQKINYKELIIPSVLIGYGLIGIESDAIKFKYRN
jgi:hypothetical protein